MITTVLIDIDDTLLDFDKSAQEAIKEMFLEHALDLPSDIMTVYYEISRPLWHKVELGEITGNELRKIRWPLILERLGIEDREVNLEEQYPKYLQRQWPLIDGAEDLVKYLSCKYTLCAASNAPRGQQEARLKGAGLYQYFSHIFESGEIGYDKPRKEFFDICLERLNVKDAGQVIMIGDSLSADISGGRAAGLKTCFVNLKAKAIEDCVPDYEVRALSEIISII